MTICLFNFQKTYPVDVNKVIDRANLQVENYAVQLEDLEKNINDLFCSVVDKYSSGTHVDPASDDKNENLIISLGGGPDSNAVQCYFSGSSARGIKDSSQVRFF